MNSSRIKPFYFLFLLFGLYSLISIVLYYNYNAFVNSSLYFASITFFVGLIALFVYIRQRVDTKSEIANIVITEIRFAEKKIKELKDSGIKRDFYLDSVLPNNTWSNSHHLFIGDLDQDEYELIRDFYNKCSLLDKALLQLSPPTQLEQKSKAMFAGISDIAKKVIDEFNVQTSLDENQRRQAQMIFKNRIQEFELLFVADNTTFQPNAPIQKVSQILNNINSVLNTPAGSKMKEIANVK